MESFADRRATPRTQLCTEMRTPQGVFIGTDLSERGLGGVTFEIDARVGSRVEIEAGFFTGRQSLRAQGIVRRVRPVESAPGWHHLGIELTQGIDSLGRVVEIGQARRGLRWPIRTWATDASQVVTRLFSRALPADIERYAASWDGPRQRFIWSWVQEGLELITLSSVEDSVREELSLAKQLGVMLNALMDDVADTTQDAALLDALLDLVLSPDWTPTVDTTRRGRCLKRAIELRDAFFRIARRLPRYRELESFLLFDLRQMGNSMRYAQLVNGRPTDLNRSEQELYQHHNMFVMPCVTLDLMASPGLDLTEVGAIRNAALNGQIMGAIGNMLTTWQRELREADYSSAVFSLAVEEKVVRADELGQVETTERRIVSSRVEQALLDTWQERRTRLRRLVSRVRSTDLELFDHGLEMLLGLSVASWGLT